MGKRMTDKEKAAIIEKEDQMLWELRRDLAYMELRKHKCSCGRIEQVNYV